MDHSLLPVSPRKAILPLCLVLAFVGCAPGGPRVNLTVRGIPFGIVSLRVSATLAGVPALMDHETQDYDSLRLAGQYRLLIQLPLGSRGALMLNADALDAQGTGLAQASGQLVLYDDGDYLLVDLNLNHQPSVPGQPDCVWLSSFALGDFDLDGSLDLAGGDGRDAVVHLNDGRGGLQGARRFLAGNGPSAVAVGDFNGDSKADLVLLTEDDSLSVLLGRGDGTFLSPRYFPATSGARAVAVGDWNGDGKLDLAVTSTKGNSVSVLLGQGDGSFSLPRHFPAGFSPFAIVVGDWNGDLLPDLGTANFSGSDVSVLLNLGDGSFSLPRHFPAGYGPVSLAAGDLNGDSMLDLIVTNTDPYGSGSGVTVLLGQGDGSFLAPRRLTPTQEAVAVALGDFNGDQRVDLAIANIVDYVSVRLGQGDGSFLAPRGFPVASFPNWVTAADLNSDGKTDLAFANIDPLCREHGYNTSHLSVLMGRGDGTFDRSLVALP